MKYEDENGKNKEPRTKNQRTIEQERIEKRE